MRRLFHHRLVSGLSVLALLLLTAVATTSMTCADGRPCGLRVFQGPMMAVSGAPAGDHSCCPASSGEGGGPSITRYGACIYNGGTYAAVVQTADQPVVVAAILPTAFSVAAPRALALPSRAKTASPAAWQAEAPPGNRGPPSC